MSFKTTHRLLRAIVARFLCLVHICLSILVLYSIKNYELVYLVPLVGALLLVVETVCVAVVWKGKEPTSWCSTAFFIYVSTIVSCYWFLELENISRSKQVLGGDTGGGGGGDFDYYKMRFDALNHETLIKSIKLIWSRVQLQIFFALIMLVRWIMPKARMSPQARSDLLFKYFAIICDMMDFLTILKDPTLVKSKLLVYATLSTWSWSTIQFFVFVPKMEQHEFAAYISESLLSVLFLDAPYSSIRILAIFGFGSHNYDSYLFAVKNVGMVLLQFIRIRATLAERRLRLQSKSQQKLNSIKSTTATANQDLALDDMNLLAATTAPPSGKHDNKPPRRRVSNRNTTRTQQQQQQQQGQGDVQELLKKRMKKRTAPNGLQTTPSTTRQQRVTVVGEQQRLARAVQTNKPLARQNDVIRGRLAQLPQEDFGDDSVFDEPTDV